MKLKNKLGAIIITCLCQSVYAQSTYGITVESDGQSFNKDFSSWEQMINSWNSEDYIIVDELPYTDISEVTETLNIHGSKIIVHYDKNSSSLVFEVPTLGIRKVFDKGETRDANAEAYFQYIDENGEDILLKLFTPKLLVATTATNPVAGNPDSLMGSVVADDFDAAKEISKSSGETASTGDKPKFGAGIELGHSTVDGHQKNIMTIPLSYTHYFAKKGYNLKLTAPISYIETDGSKAYKGSLGAALNVPINKIGQ